MVVTGLLAVGNARDQIPKIARVGANRFHLLFKREASDSFSLGFLWRRRHEIKCSYGNGTGMLGTIFIPLGAAGTPFWNVKGGALCGLSRP